MEYFNRHVAFIDILGFKSLVNQSISTPEALAKLNRIMSYIVGVHRENYSKNFPYFGKEVSAFSDSLVISWDGNFPGSCYNILMDLVFICNDLLMEGILVRGAVCYGQLIHDNNGARCFGPAMIKAYTLESQNAVYPRILIDDSTIQAGLCNPGRANTQQMEKAYLDSIMVQSPGDRAVFLDFLAQINEFDNGCEYIDYMYKAKQFIIDNLMSSQYNDQVYPKYLWMRDYFNSTVQKVFSDFSKWQIPSDLAFTIV